MHSCHRKCSEVRGQTSILTFTICSKVYNPESLVFNLHMNIRSRMAAAVLQTLGVWEMVAHDVLSCWTTNPPPPLPLHPACCFLGDPLSCLASRGQAVHLQSLRWNSDHMEHQRPGQAHTDNHPTR